ncbi:MAG: DUF4783 domain-containing protein [Bacteroidales bacterium]|jgi:hypothetical protein|nr:DUF4783 domain-containing protein [Bacteroidales bacterium]NLO42452.1 DUF4783 domain-containing protein [Bacteroidales bacterium]
MRRSFPFFLFLISFPLFSFGTKDSSLTQINIQKQIKDAFIRGNAQQLSLCFNEVVDVKINGIDATYSRYQAELIVSDFFDKNPPKTFQIEQEGNTSECVTYTIATYTTSANCLFRVYYVIKRTKKTEKLQIYELSITKNKQCQLRK